MRAAVLPTLALPLLLLDCGSNQDLVIGKLEPVAEAGKSAIPSGGAGGAAGTGGSEQGGAVAISGTGGDAALGGLPAMGGEGGVAGAGGAEGVVCASGDEPPLGSLIHRYSFDGTGSEVLDSMGGEPGQLEAGALLDGTGVLSLAGLPTRQYVNLPNGLISSHTDITFVVWVTWRGGAPFQRIFDFGISSKGEGPVSGSTGRSYVAVIASTNFPNGTGLGAQVTAPGFASMQLASTQDIEGRLAQVALVFRSGVNVELYLDGALLIRSPSPIQLSDIEDVNNWLGLSQWHQDDALDGMYDEFRIYDVALDGCQLTTLLARGADVP